MRAPRSQRRPPAWGATAAAALAGGGCLAACYGGRVFPTVLAQKEDVIHADVDERLSLRKHRFMHFASLEYEGEYYMTPRDFLFSVMFDQVERKASAKKLTKKEVDAALVYVAKAKPGPNFFRELGDKGLISYAEYLFLLTILTKPQTGLQIAFKMLDADGNEQVEKKEFFKLQRIIGKEDDLKAAGDETILRDTELDSCGVNTVLLVHFFGKQGKDKLRFSEFFRWHKENGNCLHLLGQCEARVNQFMCLFFYCPEHRRHTENREGECLGICVQLLLASWEIKGTDTHTQRILRKCFHQM